LAKGKARAKGSVQSGQPSGSGQFLIGLVFGLVFMVVLALGTLFELGYFPAGEPAVAGARTVQDVPEPKPTAAWRFRSEWLTPQPK